MSGWCKELHSKMQSTRNEGYSLSIIRNFEKLLIEKWIDQCK